MSEEIYKTIDSKYCYPNSNTLINKLDIKDEKKLQKYEAKITAAKLLALRQQGITGNFDEEHFISIHKFLFEDIYFFAGEFRKENIAKDEFRFAEWEYIEEELKKLLKKLKDENYLKEDNNKEKISKKLAYYMSELNVLHPFREGNGRTIREFIRQLALKNGYILNLKLISPEEILKASIKSIVDTENLEEIIEKCLEKENTQ